MPFNSIRIFHAGLDENNGILKEPMRLLFNFVSYQRECLDNKKIAGGHKK